MRYLYTLAAVFFALNCIRAQAADMVVADVADSTIEIGYAFTGTSLLVFGAVDCKASEDEPGCDLIIIVRGPDMKTVVRRKERVAGIWVNGASVNYETAPGYYAVATSGEINTIANDTLKQRLAIGAPSLFLSPKPSSPAVAPEEPEFRAGLIKSRQAKALFFNQPQTILVREGRLFRVTFPAPAALPVGSYRIDIFAVRDGEILAQTSQQVLAQKSGIGAFISSSARDLPLFYGVTSLVLTLLIGFTAGAAFRNR